MAYEPSSEFLQIMEEVKSSGRPFKLTPRELLEYFGTSKRKVHVRTSIDRALQANGVKTVPDYKSEYIYADIYLKPDKDVDEKEDFIPRVKLLTAANKVPLGVTKNDTIRKAMTLMMTHDYSQLPVMNSPKSGSLDGMISWYTIGWATAKGKEIAHVKDCITRDVSVIKYESPLLDAVHAVLLNEIVLIEKLDRSICGLVTLTDIVDELVGLTEPFLLLAQIENCIRVLLEDKFTPEELQAVKFGEDAREIFTVSDLTFNEYIQLMRSGDNWERIGVPLDKEEFTKKLEEVRLVRNEVMHFSSDQLEDEQLYTLKSTAMFLKEILQ